MAPALDLRDRESLLLLSALYENVEESFCLTDARLDRPGPSILYVNRAFTRMTGYAASEVVGRTPRLLQGPQTDPEVLAELRRRLERGERFEGETVNYRKDGSAFRNRWYVVPVPGAGRVAGFLAVQRDVSGGREAAPPDLRALVAGLRHELANPVNAIKTALSVLHAGLDALPRARQREYLERVLDEVSQVEHVLRTDAGLGWLGGIRCGPLALGAFLEQLVAEGTLRDVAVPEVPPDLAVMADARGLRQVLVNLVDNGRASAEASGRPAVWLELAVCDAQVVLRVRDNGEGFSAEARSHGRELFWTSKGEGHGLGLAICERWMKAMGGALEIEAAAGGAVALAFRRAGGRR